MKIIPAIDLLDGQVVRLTHGDFRERKFYDQNSGDLARRYHDLGAEWLHVVDLAASRDGQAADTRALYKLLGAAPQAVQTGGGVRSGGDIQDRLDGGAARVVVGSMAARETDRFLGWLERFGAERIVASLDVHIDREGTPRPRIYGWTEEAGYTLWELLDLLVAGGLARALITDIGRDGAMLGPNVELYGELRRRYPDLALQASGGVSRLGDLRDLRRTGVEDVIVGKALLEGAFTLTQALEELEY
jgi:phosphoribosylformimino-5-aminoimidazole carboxamide ribotide isomerase